ncbi:hypothetical protein chiPu_0008038 [Chiloscyllium punctatum]|uniref:Uncharacterized protein n=1 Tax=Chiloscyllium punctatum TaxID=137246 RepID=A0A401SGW7_CHIPU|nr:hypothetical protein [Chiloscyllium punctatum]
MEQTQTKRVGQCRKENRDSFKGRQKEEHSRGEGEQYLGREWESHGQERVGQYQGTKEGERKKLELVLSLLPGCVCENLKECLQGF